MTWNLVSRNTAWHRVGGYVLNLRKALAAGIAGGGGTLLAGAPAARKKQRRLSRRPRRLWESQSTAANSIYRLSTSRREVFRHSADERP